LNSHYAVKVTESNWLLLFIRVRRTLLSDQQSAIKEDKNIIE